MSKNETSKEYEKRMLKAHGASWRTIPAFKRTYDFLKKVEREKPEKRRKAMIEVVETLVSTIESDMAREKSLSETLLETRSRELKHTWELMKIREKELKAWAKKINAVSSELPWARKINAVIEKQINLKNFETERFVIAFQKEGSRWKSVFVRCPTKEKNIDFNELFEGA